MTLEGPYGLSLTSPSPTPPCSQSACDSPVQSKEHNAHQQPLWPGLNHIRLSHRPHCHSRGCLCSLIALGHHPYLLTASCYFTFASTLKPRLAHTVVLTAYGTTRSWTPTAYSLLPGDVGADMDIRKLDSCWRVKALHLRHKPAHLLDLQCLQVSWFVPNPQEHLANLPLWPFSLWATCSLHRASFQKETILLLWKQHHMLWLNRRVSGTCRRVIVPQEQEAKQPGSVP